MKLILGQALVDLHFQTAIPKLEVHAISVDASDVNCAFQH